MLNKLFHGHVGFHNGVRASAGLLAGLLLIALLLMKPKYPQNIRKQGNALAMLNTFFHDVPYVFMIIGWGVKMAFYSILHLIFAKSGQYSC